MDISMPPFGDLPHLVDDVPHGRRGQAIERHAVRLQHLGSLGVVFLGRLREHIERISPRPLRYPLKRLLHPLDPISHLFYATPRLKLAMSTDSLKQVGVKIPNEIGRSERRKCWADFALEVWGQKQKIMTHRSRSYSRL
jgi:hypothetical protein